MAFIDEVKALRDSYDEKTIAHCALTYLLNNAVGRDNAKTWAQIEKHLKRRGFSNPRKENFQMGPLKKARDTKAFIGSNDQGAHKGYFIIDSREDVELIAEFISRRLASETERLQHLRELAAEFFR